MIQKTLFGISFDAVPLSGVIVEFIKVANIFQKLGYSIYLDLGYDIKYDKNNFFKQYSLGDHELMPTWIQLARIEGLQNIAGYNQTFVKNYFQALFKQNPNYSLSKFHQQLIESIAQCIINTWNKLNVSFVIIENGTLPENVLYTKALYLAIDRYGEDKKLGKYVFWRDHDLMWSSETTKAKYGHFPYPETPKIQSSLFIQHVVLHQADYNMAQKWAPNPNIAILPNTYDFKPKNTINFSHKFDIPEHAFLLARYTRIIPQKRIDRDIHLLATLKNLLGKNSIAKAIYLFVAGKYDEDIKEYGRLKKLTKGLNIEELVIFGGSLNQEAIRDLLHSADLACFLTSYDYESYGNPVGEAVANKIPFITSSYARYEDIFGHWGLKGTILPITAATDSLTITEAFAHEVLDLLLDPKKQHDYIKHNYAIGKKHFSIDALEQNVLQLIGQSHDDQ